jgi:cell pole-organizing protein PopZ
MSAAPAKTADPSMDEILASIRRIIADDDDRGPTQGRAEAAGEDTARGQEETVTNDPSSDDVLDLATVSQDQPASPTARSRRRSLHAARGRRR